MVIDARQQFAQRFISHMKAQGASSKEVMRRLQAMGPAFTQMVKSAIKPD